MNSKSKYLLASDNISTHLIQKTLIYIIKPPTHIFNLSFKTGIFSNKMEQGKTIPISKKWKIIHNSLCITASYKEHITYCAPQGSVVGQLFLTYT